MTFNDMNRSLFYKDKYSDTLAKGRRTSSTDY